MDSLSPSNRSIPFSSLHTPHRQPAALGSSPTPTPPEKSAPKRNPPAHLASRAPDVRTPSLIPSSSYAAHENDNHRAVPRQAATSISGRSHIVSCARCRPFEDWKHRHPKPAMSFLEEEGRPHPPTKRHAETPLSTGCNFKRPKPSAVRDYPEGCGRNAMAIVLFSEVNGVTDIDKCKSKDDKKHNTKFLSKENLGKKPSTKLKVLSGCKMREGKGAGSTILTGSLHQHIVEKQAREIQVSKGLNDYRSLKFEAQSPWRGESPEVAAKTLCMPVGNGEKNATGTARVNVKQALHDFDALRRAFLQAAEVVRKDGSRLVRRPDLKAAKVLKEKGRWVNCGNKIVGEVPGVEVGDQFYFRIEMCLVGLHRQIQAGIDYIPASQSNRSGCSISTSIIASGGYEDDIDNGETIVYTGQGGNNYKGDRRQKGDQVLVRGNLALKNSYRRGTPVRVIRGCKVSQGRGPSGEGNKVTVTIYNYDGLYSVVDYWSERGLSGFEVFKFKLKRLPGQPQLGSAIVKFAGRLKKRITARKNLLLEDISEGKERLPVCVVNEVDSEPRPPFFKYIIGMKYPKWLGLGSLPEGCNCVGGCFDPDKCLCAARNGGEFPYNHDGAIVQAKAVLYECGITCRCPSSCPNRVSQRGLRYRLEVFKTHNRGWGVRSWDSIPSGGFVSEYAGELLSDAEAEQRIGEDEYLFDIGTNRNDKNRWGDVSDLIGVKPSSEACPIVEDAGFTIDAKEFGNVGRFINHSCSPNLYAQNVVYDHHDLRFPHVMLFATENIPPMRELCYHYNYEEGDVQDADGNVKRKDCHCGAIDCGGRLY